MTDKIEYMGNCYPERRGGEAEAQEGMVYGTDGISPSIVATSYKGTMPKIITDNMQDKQVTTCALRGRGESGNLKVVAEQGGDIANSITTSKNASMVMEVIGSTQKNAFQGSVDGVSPTLTEAMGMGGGQIPMVKEVGNIYPATGNPQAGRIYDEQGISPALDTMEGGNRQPKILTPRRTEYGKAIRKDYESGNVQESRHNMTELTPREGDCSNTLTSVQKDNLLLETINNKKDEQNRISKTSHKTDTRKVLSVLREEIGEKTLYEKVGRLKNILEEEVLRQGLYEKSLYKGGSNKPKSQTCPSFSHGGCVHDNGEAEGVRDMWLNQEHRRSSQRLEPTEQFARELDDCLQELPHEATQAQVYLRYLRKAYGRRQRILQQTLSTLEEIWQSLHSKPQPKYRIRRLTEREVFRLMDLEEKDIDTIQAAGISGTQQYKLAGNSIVVACLYHLFRKLFVEKDCEERQLTLF